MVRKKRRPSSVALLALGTISLLQEEGEAYGALILAKADLLSGSLYPLLDRLVTECFVVKHIEQEYPFRYFYNLTYRGKRYVEKYHLEKLVGAPPFSEFE